jgi:hypothetical protein
LVQVVRLQLLRVVELVFLVLILHLTRQVKLLLVAVAAAAVFLKLVQAAVAVE